MHYKISDEAETSIIRIVGEIDLSCSTDIRDVLINCLGNKVRVIVDMAEVNMIDSSGVAAFLESCQEARRHGKTLIMAAASENVMRVLRLARLETVFPLADSVEAAKLS